MKKKKESVEDISGDMGMKRRLVLNAMADPGGLDTALTASDLPIADGAENLNQKEPPGLKEP
jgi:hypothetical protein